MNKLLTKGAIAVAGAAVVAISILGCGRPQASSLENQKLIGSLRTAISARNTQWLEQNVKVLEDRRSAGKVADEEYKEFRRIIASAQQGQWEAAEREVIKFLKAQRPTREQVEATKTEHH